MKKEYKKLLSNTGLFAIGSFGSSLLGMLFVPFYTSILSTAEYGISDLITTTTSLLFPFASLAISEAIMRFSLDRDSDKKTIYSTGVYIVLIGFVLVFILSNFMLNTTIGPYIIYFLLYFLCYSIHTITSYFVKGIEKIKVYAAAGIINTIIVISCNIVFLLWLKIGIIGYLLSSIIGHFITTIFMFLSARVYTFIQFPWKLDKYLIKRMLLFSIPIIPNSISWWVANSSDKYILNYYSSVSEVGIYSVSYKIPTIVMTVMGFFMSAWQLSAVSAYESEDAKSTFSDVYYKCIRLNVLVAIALMVTSKIFGSFLYSKDFFSAWRYVPTLILANVFNIQATFLGSVYTASKKTKMLSITTMVGAVSNIVLNFALIPFIGALGAAIATASSYFVMWIMRFVSSKGILDFHSSVYNDLILFLALVLECILIYQDNIWAWSLSIIVALGVVIYLRDIVIQIIKTLLSSVISLLHKKEK